MSWSFLNLSTCLIVPTRNPGPLWPKWLATFKSQHPEVNLLVVDSSSDDGTDFAAVLSEGQYLRIAASDFNHGSTRSLALKHLPDETEIVVFMTQDALLATSDSLERLLSAFFDPTVACAYGRQLPHAKATPLSAHARFFNYPDVSRTVSMADQQELGFKTCFLSNSFAAYRLADLLAVGGFPSNVILGEDMSVAARLLMSGKRLAYVAEACVYHSHDYTLVQEFRRYFDTGVFHARTPWLLQAFGAPRGEGLRFVLSEQSYLWRQAPAWLPLALASTLAKWLGYKLGRNEAYLPLNVKRWCSMHKGYWSYLN